MIVLEATLGRVVVFAFRALTVAVAHLAVHSLFATAAAATSSASAASTRTTATRPVSLGARGRIARRLSFSGSHGLARRFLSTRFIATRFIATRLVAAGLVTAGLVTARVVPIAVA
jgi:hypothetical protein